MECGQCFRYEKIERDDGYTEYMTVTKGKLIHVVQREIGELIFKEMSDEDFESIARPYFSLDTDLAAIYRDIISRTDSEWLKSAADFADGIAILSQDPFEALISFIISQNNNIPRIKKIIDALSFALGKQIDSSTMQNHGAAGREFYSFPTAEAILNAGEDFIFSLKTGFRAKYIIDAAQKWCSGEINAEELKHIEKLDEAVAYLCKVKGIGLKVASCALLFGFERHDPFPVDVWMKRVLEKYFEKDFAPATFGKYAGVAQQYLFDYERNNG
jgi:N-glycosylase/DNA lyase